MLVIFLVSPDFYIENYEHGTVNKLKLKWNYDSCFYSWLEDFVGNKKEYPEGYVPCEEQFKPYQACVKEALQREGIELNQTAKEVQEVCQRDVEQAKLQGSIFYQGWAFGDFRKSRFCDNF